MMLSGNDIEIDITKNDKLKEIFSRKEIGHECTIEIKFKVNEKTESTIRGSLKKISYDPDEGDEIEAKPMADQPVMIMMKPGKTKPPKPVKADYAPGY